MPEMVWSGKYDPAGSRHRPNLLASSPLHTVEAGGAWPETIVDASSANRLIAGETQQVLPALLHSLIGRVNLVYIDPPFATGLDFTSTVTLPGSGQSIRR